jgi:hypothetical protein|tara:strand:- start:150 stop:314 length:165 start_codon:yes stop_codon:yes gene_type:complete
MLKKWISTKLKERSTLDGGLMVAAGVVIIVLGPLAKFVAYGALAYGVYTIWRNE